MSRSFDQKRRNMLLIEPMLRETTVAAIKELYGAQIKEGDVTINLTRKEFEGDYSVVVFPFLRYTKEGVEVIAAKVGEYLQQNVEAVDRFNVVKGFVNLTLKDSYWSGFLAQLTGTEGFGKLPSTGKKVVLEYCGPNTNKPLHLGHIRNMVIGFSMAEILRAAGDEVHKVNIYNDRGIAISKSMVAWLEKGNGETPESSGMKGDHLAGKYYVEYDKLFRAQVAGLEKKGLGEEEAKKQAPIYQKAQELLRKWEEGDAEVMELWNTMNDWVYAGFEETFQKLGVDFEKHYYESETYVSGKKLVQEGLDKNVFYRKPDGSVWVDLTGDGLDEKLLLRNDGTSVYLTQDLGTAQARYDDYKMDKSIYVVADEQDYHFKALKATLQKLGKPYAGGIHHLSYGMVDLPTGKMKSREGTVVDADDLVQQMEDTAEHHTSELGKTEGMSESDAKGLYHMIGMGALKYYLLRVNARKRVLFNPEESIEFQGDTGPFIQYTHARIQSVLRKWEGGQQEKGEFPTILNEQEREVLLQIQQYPVAVQEAAASFDPSQIANFVFALAKMYNKFYAEISILNEPDPGTRHFRVALSRQTAMVIKDAMVLLGIEVPDRM